MSLSMRGWLWRHVGSTLLLGGLTWGGMACSARAADVEDLQWRARNHGYMDRQFRGTVFGMGASYAVPVLADLDADGDPDYLQGELDGGVTWIENIGSAAVPMWTLVTNRLAGIDFGQLSAPSLWDLDGDADLDLVVGAADGSLSLVENTGSAKVPVWAAPRPLQAGLAGLVNTRPCLTDVDGDGLTDLFFFDRVGGNASGESLALKRYEDTDPGPGWAFAPQPFPNLTASIPLAYPQFADAPRVPAPGVAFTDMNADGRLDLLIGKLDGFVKYYRHSGTLETPAFTKVAENYTAFPALGDASPGTGDVDGDGLTEILVGGYDGALTIFHNTGTPAAPVHNFKIRELNFNGDYGGRTSPVAADFDADGDSDILFGHPFGFLIHLENEGGPNSSFWRIRRALHVEHLMDIYSDLTGLAALIAPIHPKPVVFDFDGDGDLDYAASDDTGRFHGLVNRGNRHAPLWEVGTNPFPALAYTEEIRPALADVDGDGLADLVVGRADGTLDLVRNHGTASAGVWDTPEPGWLGVDAGDHAAPCLADLNQDGRLDLIVGGADGRLTVLQNTGTVAVAAWAPPIAHYGGIDVGGRSQPTVMDYEGDGDADLVVGTELGGIWLLENITPGLPVSPASITVITGASLRFQAEGPGVTWRLAKNRTGASIDPATGVYTPGVPVQGGFWERFYADESIPDNNPAGLLSNIYLQGNQTINSLRVAVEIAHPNRQQLILKLFSPAGTEITLFDGPNEAPGADVMVVFDDHGAHPPASGRLSDFAGQIAFEKWHVRIIDTAPGARGILMNLSMEVNGGDPPIDVVEAVSADGRVGRAHVNVVAAADAVRNGRAVIVAGGRSPDDPVWAATDHLARQAYRTLLQRGFAKEDIQYLSYRTGIDADGNGDANDDVDGFASLAGVTAALTTFAAERENLFLYIVDHGTELDGQGYARLNAAENLSSGQLGALLGGLTTNHGVRVAAVLDFCHAGAFLPALGAASNRTVAASCGAGELAYFLAGGNLSFSSVFFSTLLLGQDLEAAFLTAAAAMEPYQRAELDDSGDGAYTEGGDGGAAREQFLGSSLTTGSDIPAILGHTWHQTITNNAPVRLECNALASYFELERVWAVVVPPNFQPPAGSEAPVVEIAEVEIPYNPLRTRYMADYNGFTEPGDYHVVFLARDIFGGVSQPRTIRISQQGVEKRVVLAAAGDPSAPEFAAVRAGADLAHGVYASRLFDAGQIDYLSAQPGAGSPVDGACTGEALHGAVTNALARAEHVVLHLIGTGVESGLRLNAAGEVLTPATLAAWLAEAARPDKDITLVLDFSGAGAFIPAVAGSNRVVIASAAAGRTAVMQAGLGFTPQWLASVQAGRSVGESVREARRSVRRLTGNLRQRVLLDDDGDGVPNEKGEDGLTSLGRFIGSAFVTGEDVPFIGRVTPPQTLSGSPSALLWAAEVTDSHGVSNVWVEITPPDATASSLTTRVDLLWNPGTARHEALHAGFTVPGVHTLSFLAADAEGRVSAPVQSEVTVVPAPRLALERVLPDRFEPDDDHAQARRVDLPAAEYHTLHAAGDCDWVVFLARSNLVYDIETRHFTNTIDTVIRLHRVLPDGSLTLVDEVDEFDAGLGELTGLDFPETGLYAVQVCAAGGAPHAPGDYELIIHTPVAPEGIIVTAYTTAPLALRAGAEARLWQGSTLVETRLTDAWGTTTFIRPPGSYRVEVVPPAGTLPDFLETDATQQASVANSFYGNPKNISAGSFARDSRTGTYFTSTVFSFRPAVRLTGTVVDGETGQPVAGAPLRVVTSPPSTAPPLTGYPWATYAAPWLTGAGGDLPADTVLPPGRAWSATIDLSARGYAPRTLSLNTPASPGAVVALGTIALQPRDTNGNTIADSWEMAHFGVLVPWWEDSDGDGLPHYAEYAAGSDPRDPGSRFMVPELAMVDGHARLSWPVLPGRQYAVWATEAELSAWTDRSGWLPVAPGQATQSWSDPLPAGSQRFYLIQVRKP